MPRPVKGAQQAAQAAPQGAQDNDYLELVDEVIVNMWVQLVALMEGLNPSDVSWSDYKIIGMVLGSLSDFAPTAALQEPPTCSQAIATIVSEQWANLAKKAFSGSRVDRSATRLMSRFDSHQLFGRIIATAITDKK